MKIFFIFIASILACSAQLVPNRRRDFQPVVSSGPPLTANLIDWWDNRSADFAVTGQLVNSWTGRTSGLVMTGTTTTRPTLTNVASASYVYFNGSYLALPAGFTWNKQSSSLFVVMRRSSTTSTTASLWQTDPTGNSDAILLSAQDFKTWNDNAGPNDATIYFADNITTAYRVASSSNTTVGISGETASLTGNASGTSAGGGYLGAWASAGFPLDDSDVLGVVTYNRTLSSAEINSVLDWTTTYYNSKGRSYSKYLLYDGDSLTYGTQSSNHRYYSYSDQLARLVTASGQPKYGNVGIGGQLIQNTTAATLAKAQLALNTGITTRTLVFWMGSNDINNGRTAAQIEGNITTYLGAVRAADAGVKIVGLTIMPRSDNTGGEESVRATLNAWIAGGGGGFDYYCDVAADARLSNASDTTYFDPDGVHLNNTGYGVVAALVKAVLDTNSRL